MTISQASFSYEIGWGLSDCPLSLGVVLTVVFLLSLMYCTVHFVFPLFYGLILLGPSYLDVFVTISLMNRILTITVQKKKKKSVQV